MFMKKAIQINDVMNIEIKKQKKRTIIILNKSSQRKILSDLKTDDYFWSDVVYDKNYVVVYSRGCMLNQIPINIEAAYDIKEERMLDLSDRKLKILLEYMYISKRGFELADILTFINKEDLQILDEESKGDLRRILTSGNKKITDEEVVNYILNKYPIFSNYRNLKGPLSVIDYKKIKKEIGEDFFRFHLMPQSLKFVEKLNLALEKKNFNVLTVPCNRSFVVTPEKSEEFENIKPNSEVRQQMEEISKKINVNNLVEEGPVLKKNKPFNKR